MSRDMTREEKKKSKISKFESPERLKKLGIAESIELLNLDKSSRVLEIGSGTGVFIFEAAKKAKEAVSIEMNDLMLEIQEDKKKEGEGENVTVIHENVEGRNLNFEDRYFKGALLMTLLHEVDDKDKLAEELYRVLETEGRLVVVEFKDEETESGPPLDERLSKEDTEKIFTKYGFRLADYDSEMGPFYRTVFEK